MRITQTDLALPSTANNVLVSDGTNWMSNNAIREKLTGARTYYVRTDGSDSNTGLANTAGGAFLTIQKACDVSASIDTDIYNVTIQIADGTYSAGVSVKKLTGAGTLTIQGNSGTPANVHISLTSGDCIINSYGQVLTVKDMKLTTGASGTAIYTNNLSRTTIGNIVFGVAQIHIRAEGLSCILLSTNYSIVASSSYHIYCLNSYFVSASYTVTISNTPTIGVFVHCGALANVDFFAGMTFSGSTTGGKKYDVTRNGILSSGGATFPGSSAGTTSNGGLYF